jgi:hypothetical protein
MSLGLWPDAVPFDPESGTASHDLRARLDLDAAPSAMLLVSGGTQQRTAWAARAAAAIASAMSDAGRRVVLADLDFGMPTLHTEFGEANAEGVADVLLFGASLERVASRPAGQSFDLVAPGAFAPDPVEIMLDAGWTRVLGDLAASGGTFIGYLSADAPGADLIAERIPDVIVLANENEVAAAVARLPESILLRALVRPAEPAPVDATVAPETPEARGEVVAAPAEEPEPLTSLADEALAAAIVGGEASPDAPDAPDATLRAMIDDIRDRQRVASSRSARATKDGSPVQTALETLPSPEGVPAVRHTPRQRATRLPFAILTLAMIAVLVGGVLFGRRYLASRAANRASAGNQQSGATGPAEPRGRPLTYSVAIESFDALDIASRRADSLTTASGVTFYVAPFRLDNATFYRVLAGPLADSASAATLMQTLVVQGAKTAEAADDVRETPLAFLIGAYDVRVDADARKNQLRESGVPSYVVEVPYTSGPVRYHLYAGAYGVPSEAEAMRALLRNAGVADTLVVRIGQVGT